MSSRLTSALWVDAYLRQVRLDGAFCYLAKRGAEAAGAIYVNMSLPDGNQALYGPAPQSEMTDELTSIEDRMFELLQTSSAEEVATRLEKEKRFDPDIWVIEIENSAGIHGLKLVDTDR